MTVGINPYHAACLFSTISSVGLNARKVTVAVVTGCHGNERGREGSAAEVTGSEEAEVPRREPPKSRSGGFQRVKTRRNHQRSAGSRVAEREPEHGEQIEINDHNKIAPPSM